MFVLVFADIPFSMDLGSHSVALGVDPSRFMLLLAIVALLPIAWWARPGRR